MRDTFVHSFIQEELFRSERSFPICLGCLSLSKCTIHASLCAKKNVQSGHLAGRQNTLNRILHRTELCPKSIKSRRWLRQLEAMGKSFMAYYCSFYIMLESFYFGGPVDWVELEYNIYVWLFNQMAQSVAICRKWTIPEVEEDDAAGKIWRRRKRVRGCGKHSIPCHPGCLDLIGLCLDFDFQVLWTTWDGGCRHDWGPRVAAC